DRAAVLGEGDEEVLAGDVLVLELLRLVLGLVDILEQPLAEPASVAALDLGKALEGLVDPALHQARVGADPAEESLGHALLLGEQRLREVLGLDLGGAHAARKGLRSLEGLLGLQGELFDAHGVTVSPGTKLARSPGEGTSPRDGEIRGTRRVSLPAG